MKETLLFGCVSIVLGLGLVILSLLMIQDSSFFGIGVLSGAMMFSVGIVLLVVSPLRGICPDCGVVLRSDDPVCPVCAHNRLTPHPPLQVRRQSSGR